MLRAHFKEKDATTLFISLGTAKQQNSESAQEFVIRLMALKQKILFVSKEDPCPLDYLTVQRRFLQAIYTGLKNENVRSQMRSILKTEKTSDEELLEKLTLIVADEVEHLEKFSKTKDIKVSSVSENEVLTTKKEKKPNPVLEELTCMRTELQDFISLCSVGTQRVGFTGSHFKNNKNPGANPRNQNSKNQNVRRRCENCSKIKDGSVVCDHCFKCGSDEHFARGCKKKNRDQLFQMGMGQLL